MATRLTSRWIVPAAVVVLLLLVLAVDLVQIVRVATAQRVSVRDEVRLRFVPDDIVLQVNPRSLRRSSALRLGDGWDEVRRQGAWMVERIGRLEVALAPGRSYEELVLDMRVAGRSERSVEVKVDGRKAEVVTVGPEEGTFRVELDGVVAGPRPLAVELSLVEPRRRPSGSRRLQLRRVAVVREAGASLGELGSGPGVRRHDHRIVIHRPGRLEMLLDVPPEARWLEVQYQYQGELLPPTGGRLEVWRGPDRVSDAHLGPHDGRPRDLRVDLGVSAAPPRVVIDTDLRPPDDRLLVDELIVVVPR